MLLRGLLMVRVILVVLLLTVTFGLRCANLGQHSDLRQLVPQVNRKLLVQHVYEFGLHIVQNLIYSMN